MTLANGSLAGTGINALLSVAMDSDSWNSGVPRDDGTERWLMRVSDYSIEEAINQHIHRGLRNIRTPASATPTNARYGIKVSGEVDSAWPFCLAYGNVSATTDPTVTVFRGASHTTPSKTYLPSSTLSLVYDEATDESLALRGCTCGSCDFTVQRDQPLTASMDFTAYDLVRNKTLQTLTDPAIQWGFWNCELKVKQGASAYNDSGAETISGWESLKWNVNNNLIARPRPNSLYIRQPVPGVWDGGLTLQRGFIDDDLWEDLVGGGVESFRAVFTDGSDTLTVEFDGCYSQPAKHSGRDRDEQSMDEVTFVVLDSNAVIADSGTYVAWD